PWCRRHLRLIDPTPRVWFHALDEISMKPLELTRRINVRSTTRRRHTYKQATSDPTVMKTLCDACHTVGEARDYVYTNNGRGKQGEGAMKRTWTLVAGLVAFLIGGTTMTHTSTAPFRGAPIEGGAGANAIRPFRVHFSDEALADLKRRVLATRWPEQETVA